MTEGESANIPMSLLGWVCGCTVIWSGLFAGGNFFYGRTSMGWILTAIFVVSGCGLIAVIRRLWR